jgi:hypothetical protein
VKSKPRGASTRIRRHGRKLRVMAAGCCSACGSFAGREGGPELTVHGVPGLRPWVEAHGSDWTPEHHPPGARERSGAMPRRRQRTHYGFTEGELRLVERRDADNPAVPKATREPRGSRKSFN